jgi:hypothetical protein
MIHEAECHIVLEPGIGIGSFIKAEPPIPTDAQIEEVFPTWKLKAQLFVERCCKEENRQINNLTASEFFRYGMKFMICESIKLC